eukprot:861008_1
MNKHHNFRSALHKLQGGNRAKRGVPEQIGTLKIVAQTAIDFGVPLFCAALDIRKAFDTVWRKGLLYKLLTKCNIPIHICKSIRALYENSHSSIKSFPFISNLFETKNGVLQGSVLSPILFAAFLDDLVHELHDSDLGASSPDHPLNRIACIFYADDVILTANTLVELQQLLDICDDHSKHWAYSFNISKCKMMIYNDNAYKPERLISHLSIPQIDVINDEYWHQIRTDRVAPMVILNCKNTAHVIVRDIHNKIVSYPTKLIPNNIMKQYKAHKEFYGNGNKPFYIIWNNTPFDRDNSITRAHHMIKLTNHKTGIRESLVQTTHFRYLGAMLDTHDPVNIVSTHHTNRNFLKRLTKKTLLLNKVDFDHDYISFADKVHILKTFYLVYTEIFSQILDLTDENVRVAYDEQQKQIQKHLNVTNYDHQQMAIFLGAPFPQQRWEVLKLVFFWKLRKRPLDCFLYDWAKNNEYLD